MMKSSTTSITNHISIRQTFSALQYPNYRLWFFGQLTSLVGTWMQNTAQAYLVYELTKSPAYLGYVGFASGLPSWLFTLYGGVVADRFSRRNLLLITQTSMMLLAFALAALVFSDTVQPWMIIVMAFLLGVANAFDAPSRVSFVAELVDRKDLTNAIALNSTMFHSATVVGPAAAGLAYAAFGPAWCFTINGLSFIAIIIALLLMKLPAIQRQRGGGSAIAQIKEGLAFANQNATIRTLIINIGILSLCGLSLMTFFPLGQQIFLAGTPAPMVCAIWSWDRGSGGSSDDCIAWIF